MLSHHRCALAELSLAGAPASHAVPTEFTALVQSLGRCRTLTRADISGHNAASLPGSLLALRGLLRGGGAAPSPLAHLVLHSNGFDADGLRALVREWRRSNLSLRSATLFAADPRDGDARATLSREGVRSMRLATELVAEAERLGARNTELARVLAQRGHAPPRPS